MMDFSVFLFIGGSEVYFSFYVSFYVFLSVCVHLYMLHVNMVVNSLYSLLLSRVFPL